MTVLQLEDMARANPARGDMEGHKGGQVMAPSQHVND